MSRQLVDDDAPPRVRIGVCLLPERPWAQSADLWRRIEGLGADHAWTYDHLVWGGLPDAPWYSTMPTLAAAATVTDRMGLGTFVASPNFRHPALLAKDAVTLDDLSGGRFLLGLGAGGDLDSGLLGAAPPRAERTRRFAEFTGLLDRLLTEDHVHHDGEFYTTRDARLLPGCIQHPRIPFAVAANGPRGMRVAAAHGDAWVTTGPLAGAAPERADDVHTQLEDWWAGVGGLARRLTQIERSERTGRPPLRRLLSLDAAGPPALTDAGFAREQVARAAELGFTDVIVHWPRAEHPYRGSEAALESLLIR